jgi:hypothetical protein
MSGYKKGEKMKNLRGFWLVIMGLVLLTACQGQSNQRLWLKAPDWSRAQMVGGMGIPDPAPFVVDDAGNIYFLFLDGELESLQARIAALNNSGEMLWQHTFNDVWKLPDDPELVWDGEILQGFWMNSGALISIRFDKEGNVHQDPTVISGDIRVDSFSAAGGDSGGLAVWFAADPRESGLYLADLSNSQEPLLVDDEGVFPSLRFDKSGTLHAVWAHAPSGETQVAFLYAAYEDGRFSPGPGLIVRELSIPLTADMLGPTLGLDAENIYIYWIEIFRTGLDAGSTETRYVSFPRSAPDQVSEPQITYIPREHDVSYELFAGESVHVGDRHSLASPPSPSVAVLQDISTNMVQEDELAVGFKASIDYYWRRSANQVGLIYIQDGRPTSYQLLSFTQQPSTDPTIVSDADGNLFASWLESGDVSRFDVYLASTSDELKAAFNPLTVNDVTDLTASTLFGLLTGILLAPVAAVLFLVLPMLVIGLTSIFRRGDQTIRSPGTIISFILAIAIFQVAKFAALPGMTDYVPFSAWLPLPEFLKAPLQIIVPVVIMIGAIFSAWHFTYRQKTDSPLYFMILYVAVDTLFTMSVYGVLFYGAF